MSLCTIGYGGVPWPSFVEALAEAGVQVVVDVRLTPWSKSAPCYRRDDLALALSQLGLGYVHDADLGNPVQDECRADKSLAPYRQHLLAHLGVLAPVRQLLASGTAVALLCGCPRQDQCHRGVIAEELRRLTPGLVVRHLHPPQGEDRGPAPKILGLTLMQPWAHAVIAEGKPVENRTWRPWCPIGTYLAIHAGKTYDIDGEHWIASALGRQLPPRKHHDTGAIVGVARLAAVVEGGVLDAKVVAGRLPATMEPGGPGWDWYCGPKGWVLDEVVKLPKPLPCKGAQGLWRVPDDVLPLLRKQWALGRLHQELAKVVSADATAIAAAEPAQTMAELLAESVRIYGPQTGTSMAATCWRDVQAEAHLHARQQEGEHVRLRELATRLGGRYGSPSP